MGQWTEYKAMESCFGEDMMKTSMLKMKKAVVKCTGMDMPELDLPMYKSPHRVVHALLESASDLQQMKMLKAFQQLGQVHQQSNNQPQGIQLVLGQQPQPQDNMFKKMMMRRMMKKFMHQKHKRAADDVFELGDRLTEKLKQNRKDASQARKCLLHSPRTRNDRR